MKLKIIDHCTKCGGDGESLDECNVCHGCLEGCCDCEDEYKEEEREE